MKKVNLLFSLTALFIFAFLQTFCKTIQNDFHTRREALLTTYNKVGDFYENSCVIVSNDSKSDIVKHDGTFLTNFVYEEIKPFYHHFAAVKKAGKWGFIINLI